MTASAGPALKQLYQKYRNTIAFVTLYVREAHPGNRYPQPQTFEEKLEHARAYQQRDRISWPVAVDDISGSLHRALDPKPNAVYLMDTNGKVAFRSLWANDIRAVEQALQKMQRVGPEPIGEKQTHAVPMLRGLGCMHEILEESGPVAKRDVLKQMPPMYAMARLARLFRPLPPMGRSLAAMSVALAGLGFIGWGALSRRSGQSG